MRRYFTFCGKWLAIFDALPPPNQAESNPQRLNGCGWSDPSVVIKRRNGNEFISKFSSPCFPFLPGVGGGHEARPPFRQIYDLGRHLMTQQFTHYPPFHSPPGHHKTTHDAGPLTLVPTFLLVLLVLPVFLLSYLMTHLVSLLAFVFTFYYLLRMKHSLGD